ncbi:MAG: hypothetical protein H7145_13095, partial [Akkermansiaceae bacterium]|nr:hypothetical protein [Armatimonadota bacterium]
MITAACLLALIVAVPADPPHIPATKPTGGSVSVLSSVKNIRAGPLTLEVRVGTRTAHVFHVVDQLSGWSEYCHAQYRRYWEKTHGPFTEAETALLAEHAEIRRRRGWGSLEPIFYTPKGLEAALADPRLGTVDATTERRVFAAFAPRIEEMMAS